MKVFVFAAAMVALALAADPPAFDLRASFDLVDASKDGKIQKAEFDGLYSTFDDNSDGKITTQEFATHYVKTGMSAKGSVYLFYRSDANDDGNLDRAEVEALFNKFDNDGDNEVTYPEYAGLMTVLLNELAIAGATGAKLDVMFATADVDNDKSLTADQLWGVISPADTDGDNLVSLAEFKPYWMAQAGEPESRTEQLFAMMDGDNSGFLGEDANKQAVFASFDYNKDGRVSKDEFDYSMLYLLAQLMEAAAAMPTKTQQTFDVKANFMRADNNSDGFISEAEFASVDEVSVVNFIKLYASLGMAQPGSLYVFFRLDGNDDNKLTKAELEDAYETFDVNDDSKVTLDEYSAQWNKIFAELAMAKKTGEKLDVMFVEADTDKDDSLTRNELASVFLAADTDKSGLISEAEFKTFWTMKTNEPEERTDLFFAYIDGDDDGNFGNDQERIGFFDGFDYNDDGKVSKEEFDNSMLFIFAKIIGQLDAAKAAKEVIGYFF